jgi:enoyl-CoA hydratase/carnithine racemase
MQQAYRLLRVVAEAQTIRMVFAFAPGKLLLRELVSACTALIQENSSGIKAVVLDFQDNAGTGDKDKDADNQAVSENDLHQAIQAVQALQPPVLAVVRGTLSTVASQLIQAADLILVAQTAVLSLPTHDDIGKAKDTRQETITGAEALRLGLVSWSVPARAIDAEMERVLDMLRNKSGVALRLTKASVRMGSTSPNTSASNDKATETKRLDALKQVNEFYLTHVMQTTDAAEGLRAFLDKRRPHWKNR